MFSQFSGVDTIVQMRERKHRLEVVAVLKGTARQEAQQTEYVWPSVVKRGACEHEGGAITQ
jgi:hypothetical protein